MNGSETKEQVKGLWRLCFPDDPDCFLELYFSSRYTDETNCAIVEDGRVVSALQRIPYLMRFRSATIPVAYVSGACTHPHFRSRGLMSRLLCEAHRKMYSEGKYLSVLIPADEGLAGYYSRFGYEVCFPQEERSWTAMCGTAADSSTGLMFDETDLSDAAWPAVCHFINRRLSACQASILHPLQDMRIVLADLALFCGQVWYAHDADGDIHAVALLVADGDRVVMKELLSVDDESRTDMLCFISRRYHASRIVMPLPCGMVRVIDAYAMLRLSACGLEGRYVEIYGDDVIPENDGLYLLAGGGCRRVDSGELPLGTECVRMHINDMPSRLFLGLRPYMSLMLD